MLATSEGIRVLGEDRLLKEIVQCLDELENVRLNH